MDVGQRTTPAELPIYGDPYTEIALELIFAKENPNFLLNGKTLQLLKPLDRDQDNLSHIVFQISCTIRSTRIKRSIPIIVRVSDVNDNAPVFINAPYQTTVPESTPVGTTIFRNIKAEDKDAGVNGLVEYFIVESLNGTKSDDTLTSADGYGTFAISFPHQGQVTVVKTLDYERIQRYYLTIVASDRARNSSERLSATTTLTVDIADSDDLDPSFIYRGCNLLDGACINPEYSASVPSGSLQGVLSVHPERIQAVDLDTISSPIQYTFLSGVPNNYNSFFEIDAQTGVLKQIKPVDTTVAKQFDIIVKAEEISESKRFTTAKLTITIKPVDANPPVIVASEIEGYVDENSPVGTKVYDSKNNPIMLTATDADLTENDPKPEYIFELTTPSFTVSKDGMLLVNEEGLDRDAPSPGIYRFQVVAREAVSNAASAPLSMTVILKDVNDNAPKLPMVSPITIPAGDGRRFVAKVTATDNDAGENAIPAYSIFHVSNNGANKFTIDTKTGEIETRGKMSAGEQFSITVQASDIGGLSSQAIVEVTVSPGPNTKPPKFVKPVYEVQVSEGAEINSTVAVVKAEDPEDDPVRYIITSGNDLRQFAVGQDTGVISVIRKLDREDLTRYQLIIRAEDSGGLASSATVNIKVTDINDKNPEFDESSLPYVFSIDEGKADAFVGTVHATDADDGVNAEITYSIPVDIPFKIDGRSGEIRTKTQLDYETQTEYKFVVTAKDGAPDARLGTASVTVHVKDIPDEVPMFTESTIETSLPENVPDYLLATVRAHDPDTVKEITYTLKRGPGDLFKVDAKTGQVKTIRGLDFEKEKQHELIIGTLENKGNEVGDYIKIVVEVEDRNDIPPVFVSVPEPVTVSDDQPIGAFVGSMRAVDGDGSSPGNVVRYEMVGRGKSLKYFQVDPDSGDVRIRDELRKEEDTEYQVDIRAYDLGEPQLSSVATLPVFVRHLLTDPNADMMEASVDNGVIRNPEMVGLAFSDDSYTTSVPETTGINATIKLIQIINSKKASKINPGFKCEILKGNIDGMFRITLEDHACGITLASSLDYETKTSYDLDVRLVSSKYFVNPHKSSAKVKIIVQDENDNEPKFVFDRQVQGRMSTYYAVISSDAELDTPVLQIKAEDRDSGKYGMIKYRIYDEDSNDISSDKLPSNYFAIVEDSGILKTQKKAFDNNGTNDNSHRTRARVVVNLIADINRMSLVFSDSTPKEIRKHYRELEELISDKSNGYITGIERTSNRKYLNDNGTITENASATDVWFYIIDPKSEKILPRNASVVMSKILEPAAQSEINFEASGIARATAQGIYAPIVAREAVHKVKAAIAINDDAIFPYTLIAIAVIILVLGTIGIIYICLSWSKYKNFKQRMRQYSAPSSPTRYDPVIVGSQSGDTASTLKEYETQVLAMAVPNDETDDLQIDFSAKNHAFSLDNVSYITHKENGQISPSNSEATTAVITTLRRNNNNNNVNLTHNNNRQNTFNRTLEMNRNNANPLAIGSTGTLPGTLTLGRIKADRNNYQNGYNQDTLGRNNLQMSQNNTFNTLGRNGNVFQRNSAQNDLSTSTLGRNNRFSDVPITNPLFQQRQNGDSLYNHNHSSVNENVTFGKRDYSQLGFAYLNDLDRSEVETTTEL
ncbi:hypothetical protein HA402_000283 [Bradysia odoriphaga]|nr:hypothetical protein HA402_000283 [Bradysia odoriphaga]